MDELMLRQFSLLLQNAHRILVISHVRPDGDAVGSLVGLGLALEEAGKSVQMVLADGVPKVYRFLDGSEKVIKKPSGEFDFTCVVDTSDLPRSGGYFEGNEPPDVNIDHHITNNHFANINLIDTKAVSTTQVLAKLIPQLITPITQQVATALLMGLITDTLGLRTSNMTPEALIVAAELMDAGADLFDIYQRTLGTRSYKATRLWGSGLNRIDREGGIVWTTLTLEDRSSIGYPGFDDADLINVLSSVNDANVSVIFLEQPNDHVKVSWRANPGYDVSKIALSFGGGGHPTASGADITGTLDEVRKAVIQKTITYVSNNNKMEHTTN